MENRYLTISGGEEGQIKWWAWETLDDVLTKPLLNVDILSEKYSSNPSLEDLKYVNQALKEIFVNNTSFDGMTTVTALNSMMKFSTAMDWMVYIQNKILNVLQDELKLYLQKSGKYDPDRVTNIYDALQLIDLDEEGMKLRNELYEGIYGVLMFNMDEIYSEISHVHHISYTDKLHDEYPETMSSQDISAQMLSLLTIAKRHALVMDRMAKKKVLNTVFAKSAIMAEYLSNLTKSTHKD